MALAVWPVLFLSTAVFPQEAFPSGTAEEAWKGLLNEKHQRVRAFDYVQNNPALANVLIYGDSISIGYTSYVRSMLKEQANVYRIHQNGSDSSKFISFMTEMETTMRNPALQDHWNFKWDVIHFNVGMHDLKHTLNGVLDTNGQLQTNPEEYKGNLRKIVEYLQQIAPEARIIFATTTPVPENAEGRFSDDAVKYNQAAMEVFQEFPQVVINDLHSFTKPRQAEWWRKPGDVHYDKPGQREQAKEVSRVILETLKIP